MPRICLLGAQLGVPTWKKQLCQTVTLAATLLLSLGPCRPTRFEYNSMQCNGGVAQTRAASPRVAVERGRLRLPGLRSKDYSPDTRTGPVNVESLENPAPSLSAPVWTLLSSIT